MACSACTSCGTSCADTCCTGTRALTPMAVYNRPGLDQLQHRVGEHGAFFATMLARLSSGDLPALAGLGARTTDDPSIAMLDAWACLADVLTFYQERIANEGFLRTATERRSVLELARLIGYTPRPGVAATVYLAYEIDKNTAGPVEIAAFAKVQSLPEPGELPQTFETIEKLVARREWNAILPRLERPQNLRRAVFGTETTAGGRLFFKGIVTGVKPNDALLLQLPDGELKAFRVKDVAPDSTADRTLVRFTRWNGGEILVPGELEIRRALVAFRRSPPEQQPPDSLAQVLLTEVGEFLGWLHQAAEAEERDAEVDVVVRHPVVLRRILSAVDDLRAAALAFEVDRSDSTALERATINIAQLSSQIEEITEMDGGGVVGDRADELAERLQAIDPDETPAAKDDERVSVVIRKILRGLAAPRSVPPRNAAALVRKPVDVFDFRSDVGSQAVSALAPQVARELATATANARVAPEIPLRVFVLRHRAQLFGSMAPRKVTEVRESTGVAETEEWSDADIHSAEETDAIFLDQPQEKIKPGSFVLLDYSAVDPKALGGIELPTSGEDRVIVARAGAVSGKISRAAYNFSGQTTRIPLLARGSSLKWFTYTAHPGAAPETTEAFQFIRRLAVYADSEEMVLAPEPLEDPICGGDEWIETDALYSGLETGRWLVVSGERADVPDTGGVRGSELVMLDAVRQYVQKVDPRQFGARNGKTPAPSGFEPGEKLHTFIKLATPLAYCYRRTTVAFNANVVKATHGETRTEVLGGGDATLPLQAFTLRQPPLTFVSAKQPDGIDSTLRLYVNGVKWHETEALGALRPTEHAFTTRTDDESKTSVVFGNGVHGARLPTGIENVKAIYRSGIGKGGNVKAGQISQLLSRPLGVKAVNNPEEAAGGADRETRDQARRNAPLAVMALDRLVSTRDYADFSRTFAGIAKATAARLFVDGSAAVYVTIAGVDDMPIPTSSDLFANLVGALKTYGDADLAVRVELRRLRLLVMSARIAIHPDHQWDDVVAGVRAKLLERYSFERRELGQSIVLSDVVATIHAQRGVRYVDVDALGAVAQTTEDGELRSPQEIAAAFKDVIDDAVNNGRPAAFVPVRGISQSKTGVRPAEIAFFVPSLAETLLLHQIED